MSGHDVRFAHVPIDLLVGRLIRNPAYGGPSVGPYGWTHRPELSKHGKEGFQAALASSIKEEGVRNPILVWCFKEGLFLTFGGSRVRACQEAGITTIPAIINDYTGDYKTAIPVTPENVESFFTDPPRDYEFTEQGFDYHYNLERARRANHDPAGFAWLDETPAWIAKEFPWLIEGVKNG